MPPVKVALYDHTYLNGQNCKVSGFEDDVSIQIDEAGLTDLQQILMNVNNIPNHVEEKSKLNASLEKKR